jgi:hypothetical protein
MSWYSLFRQSVVPVVQQTVSSTNQPSEAISAPAAADSSSGATGTLSEKRRQSGGGSGFKNFYVDPASVSSEPAAFAPSGFAQGNDALIALEQALYNGQELPPEIRARLAEMATPEYVNNGLNIMGIRDEWLNDNPWGRGDLSLATDQQLYDEFRNLQQWRADHAGNALSREFGDELQALGALDFTGLSSLALGDMNPHGLLGLQLDAAADLTGTKPEEWAGGLRSIAGAMNPFVGAGIAMGPVAAYGADVGDQAESYARGQALRYVGGQIAPYVSAGVSAGAEWIRQLAQQLGITTEQAEALASGINPDAVANVDYAGSADIGAEIPGLPSDMAPQFSRPASVWTGEEGGGMLRTGGFPQAQMMSSTPATTTFSGEGMLPVEMPTDDVLRAMGIDVAGAGAAALSEPTLEQEQPEQSTGEKVAEKVVNRTINNALQRAVNELFAEDAPADAPVRDEGETDAQYQEELLTYLNIDPQSMADLGLEPGTPEYMARILEQADQRIAELTEGLDLNAEDLSAQLRQMTDEDLKALQRALYVRGQLEAQTSGSTVIDPTTGEEIDLGTKGGMLNPGVAGYQAGLARDIEGITSVDQLNKLLTRGFDPYGMQADKDARFEQAKRNEREEEEMRRRRRGGMLGL